MKKSLTLFLLFALIVLTVLSGGCGKSQEEIDKEYVKGVRQAAVGRSSDAQQELASIYALGLRHIDRNPAATVFWIRKIAERGYAEAQYATGKSYYYGEGVSKHEEEAFYWINQAAQQGHNEAKEFLSKTPHGVIQTRPFDPFNWGYYISSAFVGDIFDAYGWLIGIGILLMCTVAGSPIGIVMIAYALYMFSQV